MEWVVKISKPMQVETFCVYDECTVQTVYDVTTAILTGPSYTVVKDKAERLYPGKIILSIQKYDGGYIKEDRAVFYKKKN